jgi:hypothetical protein
MITEVSNIRHFIALLTIMYVESRYTHSLFLAVEISWKGKAKSREQDKHKEKPIVPIFSLLTTYKSTKIRDVGDEAHRGKREIFLVS